MSDHDRTVDADDSTMDELRRMAAAARASVESATTDDHTVQADGGAMDELRRFAEQARQQARARPGGSLPPPAANGVDQTIGTDTVNVTELQRFAEDARRPGSPPVIPVAKSDAATDRSGLGPLPDLDPPDQRIRSFRDERRTLPDLPMAVPGPTWSSASPVTELDHTTARMSDSAEPLPSGLAANSIEGWRPPPRMVMPTEPDKRAEVSHGPWRTVAIVLAVAVLVLVAFMAFGAVTGGDDEVHTDGSVVPGLELPQDPSGTSDG